MNTNTLSPLTVRRSASRGHADHGWLKAKHSFSFAEYYDPENMHYRTLRVINEDRVAPGKGFGTHPHRDMEIITYILSGQLQHKDSMGNGRVIEAGDFQYMSAGSGVQHSEFNPSPTDPVHLLQIWIMPDVRSAAPRYEEKAMAAAAPGLHLVASKPGRDSSMAIRQDADLWLARFGEGGSTVTHRVAAGRGAWIQVAEGTITVNGEELRQGDAATLDAESDSVLEISAAGRAQAILFDLA